MNFQAELRLKLRAALEGLVPDPEPFAAMLRPAQDPRFGDFQINCAMPLAAQMGRPARDVAQQLVDSLDLDELCDAPEIAGPGFINLRLRDDLIAAETTKLLSDERLGVPVASSSKVVVIDYSGPNVAKPMHVGHLRSTVLGRSLELVMRHLGHQVITDNHLGDWGTQFGMILYGYKNFRDAAAYQSAPVQELARLYRLVNQLCDYHDLRAELPKLRDSLAEQEQQVASDESAAAAQPKNKDLAKAVKKSREVLDERAAAIASAEKKIAAVDSDAELAALAAAHPRISELARLETAKLHAGDAENVRLWNEFLPACLDALNAMYRRLGISFDLTLGESFYNPMLAEVVRELQDHKIAVESDGAVCVFIEGNAAPFIVRKADGAFSYATSDIATIKYRVETLHADVILYVVDARQSEHFELLFATAAKLGYGGIDCRHIKFGTILGNDRRPYKTRSGDTVGLESLLNEGIERARAIVDENDNSKPAPELSEDQRARIAEIVGLGGIFYADLKHNRESDYVFSWDKMLAKTGDTATYIQYAYARVMGILRKGDYAADDVRKLSGPIHLATPTERRLALQLNRFATALEDVVAEYRPNLLTQYLLETANIFAAFFDECPVLKEADASLKESRLRLCLGTADILRTGLRLLGIQVAEQM